MTLLAPFGPVQKRKVAQIVNSARPISLWQTRQNRQESQFEEISSNPSFSFLRAYMDNTGRFQDSVESMGIGDALRVQMHFFKCSVRDVLMSPVCTQGSNTINHIRNPVSGLELACNGGSCWGISWKRDKCHLRLRRLPALASVQCKLVPVQHREH